MSDSGHITLAQGNGGRLMRELIEGSIARQLDGLLMETESDATMLEWDDRGVRLMFTSDSFTVQPLEFPGGNIGSLAVNGTINDLAVAGATPRYLSLNLIIEEGLPLPQFERILQGVAQAASDTGIRIACGDTKVVPQGECSGIYITTSGIGARPLEVELGMGRIQHGDVVIVSSTLGDHGAAVMLARGDYGLTGELRSDCASVLPLTEAIRHLPGVRFMRDPTRGGFATVLHEILQSRGMGARIHESRLPIGDTVHTLCDILGFNPLHLANEGCVVAVVAADSVDQVLTAWSAHSIGSQATVVGVIREDEKRVILETELGGERFIDELEEEPLPRIC